MKEWSYLLASSCRGSIACLVVALGCCASVPVVAAESFDDIREFIRAGMVELSVPSVAVAVARDGKVVWEEGFGWADRERRIPANEHTVYSLASITKPMAATGLMTLVQAGKVDLDRAANDYLGHAKLRARIGDANQATVRRLLTHTSGLGEHYHNLYRDEPYRVPSMDETILRYGNLIMIPGEKYRYSNLGYGLVGYISERISGQSYAEFMRREVFIPLGMTHSSIDVGPGLEPYVATRYGLDGLPVPWYDHDTPAAAAAYSSAHDLIRFGLFHLKAHLADQRKILSDKSIDEMHARTPGEKAEIYKLGFQVRNKDGRRIVAHSGGMPGVSTQLWLVPDSRLAIVALSNSSSELPRRVADRIAQKLLPNWPVSGDRESPVRGPFTVPPQLLGLWQGELATYVRNVPVEVRFLADNNVHVKFGDQLTTLVSSAQFKDDTFTGEFNARIDTPDTEYYDNAISMTLEFRGDRLTGTASAASYAAAVGRPVHRPGSGRVRNALSHWLELTRQ